MSADIGHVYIERAWGLIVYWGGGAFVCGDSRRHTDVGTGLLLIPALTSSPLA